jgi:hypothetical protein
MWYPPVTWNKCLLADSSKLENMQNKCPNLYYISFYHTDIFAIVTWILECLNFAKLHSRRQHFDAIIDFLVIIHCPFFLKKVSESGLCLRPQVKSLPSWAQSVELVPISGHLNPQKAAYTYQTQHKLPMGVTTNISELHIHEAFHLWPCIMYRPDYIKSESNQYRSQN